MENVKIKNLMTPVINYFTIKKEIDYCNLNDPLNTQLPQMKKKLYKEHVKVQKILPKIKEILG